MKYIVKYTNQFKRDWKLCKKRGLQMELLQKAITILAQTGSLPAEYKPHKLSGVRSGEWECHIKPDWLLVWEQHEQELTLLMLNTGSHSDIFNK